MNKNIQDFAVRLTSRKFLVVIAGVFLAARFPQHADHIITLVGIYVAGEGLPDAVSRFSEAKYKKIVQDAQTILGDLDDEEQPDKTRVVAGASTAEPAIGATAVYPPMP
jgi:hypothetical protein